MNKENFKIIKEINSLEVKLNHFDNLKGEDKRRIERLYQQKEHRLDDLKSYSLKKDELQKELFQIEIRTQEIEKEQSNIAQQLNQVLESNLQEKLNLQKHKLDDELNNIQEKGLLNLEAIETFAIEIQDAQSFLNGIDETIDEITHEILEKQNVDNLSEDHIKKRIEEVTADLTDEFKASYIKLRKHAPVHNSLSLLENNKCQFCHYEVNAKKLEDIQVKYQLHACEMCKRLLIPPESSY
jgi:predicted  nucleic acid-binding Zn-ribbon protein